MFNASHLNVRYGQRTIIRDLSFSAKAGELTAIVGPNGSGKSTLLKAITGEIASLGDISLDGANIRNASPAELATRRAVLPQSTTIAFPFTVMEIVRIGVEAGGSASPSLALRALSRVGLAGYEGRTYNELSGGEQQRCQLARVLCQVWHPKTGDRPNWLLLDEPVSALDIGHQLEVMRIARKYADNGGGVIAVMHDLNLTAMFADSVALMRGGEILRQGTPQNVLTNADLSEAYGCPLQISTPPVDGNIPYILPQAAQFHQPR